MRYFVMAISAGPKAAQENPPTDTNDTDQGIKNHFPVMLHCIDRFFLQRRLLDFGVAAGESGRGLADLAQQDHHMFRSIHGEGFGFLYL